MCDYSCMFTDQITICFPHLTHSLTLHHTRIAGKTQAGQLSLTSLDPLSSEQRQVLAVRETPRSIPVFPLVTARHSHPRIVFKPRCMPCITIVILC